MNLENSLKAELNNLNFILPSHKYRIKKYWLNTSKKEISSFQRTKDQKLFREDNLLYRENFSSNMRKFQNSSLFIDDF